MKSLKIFSLWMAVATLGVAGLSAMPMGTAVQSRGHWRNEGEFRQFMTAYLNLTPQQQTQDKAIFKDAQKEALPVRQELMQTGHLLRVAIKADDMSQIKQLSSTEGTEIGQLTAIRSSAFAKTYQILTPAQRQKLADFERAKQAANRGEHQGPRTEVNATK